MYKKEVDDLLAGKYSKQTLKKVHAQWKKIHGTVTIPHHNFVSTAKRVLEEIFHGTLHFKYASEILCALQYCSNHHHYLTDDLLLDDIDNHKRIVFNNYLIKYQ
ncbi:hypothetical protein [Bacillus sp. V59.32b]|uniref:hypothetical protein n=1 Tax=Bacillus sp. V59.32b TaxID=1758642 RepID=UPI000E3D5697|nr:hypothetical protein [Bacillus sp. V59.32b]RFU64453.1 hypothetical protein D0463_10075 [Bacillus sp. V59.32b]